MKTILVLALLAISFPGTGNAQCRLEYDLEGTQVLGLMYTVEITGEPHVKVCGQWYKDGAIATTPNPPFRPMGPYCRETDENGYTFFSYRYRGVTDCAQAEAKLEFKIKP